jgi:putative heme-binding domain-containing protein
METRIKIRWLSLSLWFLAAMGSAQAGDLEDKIQRMADDPDPRVRFQTAFTLGEVQSPGRIEALVKIALRDAGDRWVQTAVLSSVGDDPLALHSALLEKLSGSQDPIEDGRTQFIRELCQVIGARKNAAEVSSLLKNLADSRWEALPDYQTASLAGLAAGLDLAGGEALRIPGGSEALSGFLASKDAATRELATKIAARLATVDSKEMEARLAQAAKSALDEDLDEAGRLEAIRTLRLGSFGQAKETLVTLLSAIQSDAVEISALETLNSLEDAPVAEVLLERWPDLSPAAKARAMDLLFARKERRLELLGAIEKGDMARAAIDAQRQGLILNDSDPEAAAAAKRIYGQAPAGEDPALFEKYRPALELEGDPKRGAEFHKERCAQCHKVGEVGHNLGPDWSAVRSNPRDSLVTSIVYPNRVVAPGYTQYVIETVDGDTVTGMIGVSGPTSIVVKNPNAQETTILRKTIESIRDTSMSMMPNQLADGMSVQDMADLLTFIQNP